MIIELIKKEYKRRMIDEGCHRIQDCMTRLSNQEIWSSPNENSNSVGHLLMHLNGNVRQYIFSGIADQKYIRKRDQEFDKDNIGNENKLLNELMLTVSQSIDIINKLQLKDLEEYRKVQGFEETVLSIIIHVIEHFSYHVGQITYYTKSVKNIDTGYYKGLDLNVN